MNNYETERYYNVGTDADDTPVTSSEPLEQSETPCPVCFVMMEEGSRRIGPDDFAKFLVCPSCGYEDLEE